MISRCTVIEFFGDKITDWLRMIAHDRKKFVQLHAFDGFVDNQCFCHQAKNRTKSGQNIKDKEREDDDDQITEQKSSGNVHRGVFFDDHGDDVRSAAGSILKKEQGSGDRRKQDRKTEFQ